MSSKNNDNNKHRFQFTHDGYIEAEKWLKDIGVWEKVSTGGFSTDGFSIIATANSMWEQRDESKYIKKLNYIVEELTLIRYIRDYIPILFQFVLKHQRVMCMFVEL